MAKQQGVAGGALWSASSAALLIAIPVGFAIGIGSAFLFVSAGPITTNSSSVRSRARRARAARSSLAGACSR